MITLKGGSAIYEGTSGDSKPTAGIDVNTLFHELDTNKWYYFKTDSTWGEVPNTGGGGGSFTPTEEQLAAMNSGITAADVEQIGINENNILFNTENGVANICPIVAALTPSAPGIYSNVVDDKYVLSGTMSSNAYWSVIKGITVKANTDYTLYIDHQSNTSTTRLQALVGDGTNWSVPTGGETAGTSSINTGNNTQLWVRLLPNVSAGATINDTVRLMIIPKNIGITTYHKYALSNTELTAKEQENETNISLVNQIAKTLSFKSGQPATLRFGNAKAALAVGFVQGVGTVFMSIQTTSENVISYKSLYDGSELSPTYVSYDTSTSVLSFDVNSPYYSDLLILSAATPQ